MGVGVFSIGEFSKITGLSIKTLRFYHEQGLLTPACVDEQTGYRYYDHSRVEKARIITQLRTLEFPISQIAEVLAKSDDEADILDMLERQRVSLEAKAQQYRAYAPRTAHILPGRLISSRAGAYDSPGTAQFMEENHCRIFPRLSQPAL
jgi:DNA-binding transcriptional MerR regulator